MKNITRNCILATGLTVTLGAIINSIVPDRFGYSVGFATATITYCIVHYFICYKKVVHGIKDQHKQMELEIEVRQKLRKRGL